MSVCQAHTRASTAQSSATGQISHHQHVDGNVPQHLWTPSNTWFLRPIRAHNPNGISIGSAVLAQMTAECHYTLQRDAPFPSKLSIPIGGSGPLSNTWFLRPTRVLNPKGISIGAAVFPGLTYVTDRQTDHATRSVTIVRIYVCSTAVAMRPNNTFTTCIWLMFIENSVM